MPRVAIVRQATMADLEDALPLLERFFAEEGFRTPPQQIRSELVELLTADSSAVFVAWLDERAVGVATVTTSRGIELGFSAELEDLYVLDQVRGTGIGASLIDAVKHWCRLQGCSVVSVVVTTEGEQAHNLIEYYGSRGFQDTGRRLLFAHLQ
jgi:aminoglycoside 6'-N-acetyltransferase I